MRKLQRKQGARKALLKNLATSLILYERIETTLEKAKEVRSLVERLIQKGKKNDLATFRYLLKFLPKNVAKKIVEDLAPAFKLKNSGFVRIIRSKRRSGDGAFMAIIELTERAEVKKEEPSSAEATEGKQEKKPEEKEKKEEKKNEKGKKSKS